MKTNILFINSYQRSGSTLLGMLLDYHPAITYLGEVRNIHEYLTNRLTDYSGHTLPSCPFWGQVFEKLRDDPRTVFTKTNPSRLAKSYSIKISNYLDINAITKVLSKLSNSYKEELQAYENIRKYYEAASKASRSKWLVDSSHRTSEVKDHVNFLKSNMNVVLLTRDGRGVVNSVMKRTGEDAATVTKKWRRFMHGAKAFNASLPHERQLTIKYEDLCSNLYSELRDLSNFLKVEELKPLISQSTSTSHHFIGGSSTIRHHNHPLSINLDESWRDTMSDLSLSTFEKIAGDLNRELGYV